jgi:hypothetical protein
LHRLYTVCPKHQKKNKYLYAREFSKEYHSTPTASKIITQTVYSGSTDKGYDSTVGLKFSVAIFDYVTQYSLVASVTVSEQLVASRFVVEKVRIEEAGCTETASHPGAH